MNDNLLKRLEMLLRIITCFCLLIMANFITAQKLDHVLGEVMVRIYPTANVEDLVDKNKTYTGKSTDLIVKELVSEHLNIWLLKFDPVKVDEIAFAKHLGQQAEVEAIQQNHLLELRSNTPNDSRFNEQWQYINRRQSGGTMGADIDIDLAWEITTGGLTANGDTIVVCVVDNGIDPEHRDFGDNLWLNHDEIPNNNIDDDGNGYVDDYKGWNTSNRNDNIDVINEHGTPVAGIIGAQGNNNRGVAGVNWDVKLMIVFGGTGLESEVLRAYSFPLTERKLYNESGGREGSFVVATNSSWGVDEGLAADAPLWCAFYDTLGVHGILSAGATANRDFNIDVTGDLPTSCPSDYLLSVTNMDHNDEKITTAGYGLTTIDLGAFGQGTFTTADGNSYGGFGGTSGATPHVAGTVALLYSAPCPEFADLATNSPDSASRLIRRYILEGVDANASLEGRSVTGGRLNVNNSMRLLMDNCQGCVPAYLVQTSEVIDTTVVLSWTENEGVENANLRYRPEGAMTWDTIANVTSPYLLGDLVGCSFYEVEIQTFCTDTLAQWSNTLVIKTDGCCDIPKGVVIDADPETSQVTIDWQPVLAASAYVVEYQLATDTIWTEVEVGAPPVIIENLLDCNEFNFRIESVCGMDADSLSGKSAARDFDSACACTPPANPDTLAITATTATISWEGVDAAANYNVRYKPSGPVAWKSIDTTATEITVEDLDPCTNYRFQVRSLCNITDSQYQAAVNFKTRCLVGIEEILGLSQLHLSPVPFNEELQIEMSLKESVNLKVELVDIQGKVLYSKDFGQRNVGNNLLIMNDLGKINSGIYLVKLVTENGVVVRKVLHQ